MLGWFAEESDKQKAWQRMGWYAVAEKPRCWKNWVARKNTGTTNYPSSHEQIMRMMSEWTTGCQTQHRHKLFVSFAQWRNVRAVFHVFLTNVSFITWSIAVKIWGDGRGLRNNVEKKRRGWRRDGKMLLKLLLISEGMVGYCEEDSLRPSTVFPPDSNLHVNNIIRT
jgi:hypothetical protein